MQILSWYIGKQLFGMDLRFCREVNRNIEIVPVPHSKKYIAGIVNLRGDVVTVLNLQMQLGYKIEKKPKEGIIIRLKDKNNHMQIALKADKVFDVMDIADEKLKDTPAHFNEIETRFIHNVIMSNKGLIVILNPDEIMKIE